MDHQSDYEAWKERINAVISKTVKTPNIPVDTCCAQAETIAAEATKDKELLTNAGLNPILIDELVPLSGALRYCQAQWMSEFRARQDAQKEWLKKSPAAYELRNELLHHFSFAYRDHDNIKKKVTRIREGSSHADMIQDLLELAVLGENNQDPLTTINLDLSLLENAKKLSKEMADLLASANGSSDHSSNNKLLRDKAFTLLAEHMSTIREYGRYVFWRDEERREKYINDHN
ncbi:hypothetical protein DMA11_23725 [Marinilabiliaceae bacterium JC017]|nr:hypothetical protein DMA11_23725 [Marinilabiliaceae bacterium JC017]